VVADNCDPDDKTAKICRDKGCLVYERHDMSKVRKGYALQWLFERLNKEMDITKYTGFVVMDADNVVSPNFMEKMNDVFLENYDCVRSYLNVKNMNENWIAGVSGINWYRAAVFAQRPRSMLNTCQQTCGTGFLIRSQLLTQGWPYLELAEDSEMMTHLVAQNKRIGFCEAAEIYDEQPTTLKVALRQRFRWAKGGIVNWAKNNWRILGSFIKKPTWSKYDIWWEIFPYGLVTFLFGLATTIASTVIQVSTGGNAWGSVTNYLLSITVFTYLGGWVQGVLILIKERKRVHLNFGEAVLDSFLWPFFDMIFIPISIASLFVRVGWKHTPHHVVKDPEKLVEEENARERAEEEKKANKARAIKAAAEKKDIKESDPD
jgi:cellulose synthase/poly-beta-1,6-N-acetylglucosamine synthase-like glycosyltransferase